MNKYLVKIAKLDESVIRDRFRPDLNPTEMEELGVLAKQYYNKDPKEANFFHVDASLTKWPEYWKNEEAPMGWYDWYTQYHQGRRSEDDLRQMRRWYLFKQRHLGGLRKADPTLQDLSVRPKQRQALLNWGITGGMTKDQLIEKAKEIEKQAAFEFKKSSDERVQALVEASTKDKFLGDIATKKKLSDLVAFHKDGQPVGFAIPRKDSDGHYRTGPIYIDPKHRGEGIAKQFIQQYFEGKKGRSYISADNKASMKAFESAGFKPTGKKIEDDGETLLEMKKQASIEDYVRHKYVEKDWTQLDHPVASKKWDGAHFVADVDADGQIRFFSRRPSVKGGYPERTAQLPHITDKLMPEYAGNRFAVELVHTGKNKTEVESHPTVSGILNSKLERSLATQAEKGPVRAVMIDVKNPELPTYKDKIEYLQGFEKDFGNSEVMFAPHLEHGVENINKYLEKIKQDKGEGLIVADYEKPETESVRYKVKNFNTYNLKVIGFQQEIDIHGTPKDSMGALLLEDATGRMVGKVGTGFDRATRIEAWKNPHNWQNRRIQIKAYPPSVPGGQVRFPIYNGEADGDLDTV